MGQERAKRAVAIAIRNRWRRQQLPAELRDDVAPKNIIMIGPTGVGKTEIARRLARLARAPVPQGGGDQVHRGRLRRPRRRVHDPRPDRARRVGMVKAEMAEAVRERAEPLAEERLLDLLLPRRPGEAFVSEHARGGVAGRLARRHPREAARPAPGRRAGRPDRSSSTCRRTAGPCSRSSPARAWRRSGSTSRTCSRTSCPGATRRRRVKVGEARRLLAQEEAQKLVDMDEAVSQAIQRVENSGIIFLDEIDKIAGRRRRTARTCRARACSATCCRSSRARR